MKSKSKVLFSSFLFLLIFGIFNTTQAAVLSADKKNELIAVLIAKITELQKQLAEMQAVVEAPALVVEAVEQPAASLIIAGAQSIPFTNVKLTAKGADVKVTGLTVMQTGPGSDSVLYFLGMIDGGYVNMPHSDHSYQISDAFTIKKGESKDVVLYGTAANDLTGFEGQLLRLSLTAITADAPIVGALPIAGAFHTVNSTLVAGTMTGTIGSLDPGTNKNITLNSTNVVFSGVRYDVGGQESVTIKSIKWRQGGSASTADVSNLKTVLEYRDVKKEVDALPDVDDPRYYNSDFGDGVKIAKGDSFQLYIKGDVGLGVNRTIDFNIDANDDLYATGDTYGFDIAPQLADVSGAPIEGQTSDLSDPYYNGYEHTIAGPFANITK